MRQPDIMKQLEDARLNAVLDEEPDANIDTRGVIKTTDMSLPDDLDPGMLPKIEEEQKYLTWIQECFQILKRNKKYFQSWVIDTMMIAMMIEYTKNTQLKISQNLSYREWGLVELLGHQTTWNRVTGLADRPMATVVMQGLISP